MYSSTEKPRHKPGYHLEEFDGEILLAHPAKTETIYLNEPASLIWRLCDGQRTVAEIGALLRDAFPDAADTISGDIETTLLRLVKHDAVEIG